MKIHEMEDDGDVLAFLTGQVKDYNYVLLPFYVYALIITKVLGFLITGK